MSWQHVWVHSPRRVAPRLEWRLCSIPIQSRRERLKIATSWSRPRPQRRSRTARTSMSRPGRSETQRRSSTTSSVPLALASIAGLAVSIVIGLLISRTVARPLGELTASVASLGPSDLDRRLDLDARGEVGTLVAAFNHMLDRLASTYRSQRELLANIAHELRTPLTSIQGYAQALRDGVISDESARDDALHTITDEARRMTDLVEQILQLSRLESGQLPTEYPERRNRAGSGARRTSVCPNRRRSRG